MAALAEEQGLDLPSIGSPELELAALSPVGADGEGGDSRFESGYEPAPVAASALEGSDAQQGDALPPTEAFDVESEWAAELEQRGAGAGEGASERQAPFDLEREGGLLDAA
jgi:hypothetical protein